MKASKPPSPKAPRSKPVSRQVSLAIPQPIVVREPKYRIDFQLPGLPPMTNAKGSRHWRRIYEERKTWKTMVWQVAGPQRPRAPLFKARLTLVRFSSESPDCDGLVSGFKSVIDGLRESGFIVDDKFENIAMPTYHWVEVPRGQGHIRVIVEET